MSRATNKSPMRKKSSNNAAPVAAAPVAAAQEQEQEQSYSDLFREIDSDGSGFIDRDELFQCVSSMFPDSQITMNDVQAMMEEADTNGDGNISSDEFEVVMQNAQGKNSLWGKTQANLWSRFTRGIGDTIAVAESATAPLKSISRSNSYLDADGVQIAGGGLRTIAKIAAFFAHLAVSTLIAALVALIACFVKFEVYKEIWEIFGGKEFDSVGVSDIFSSVKNLVTNVFDLMSLSQKGKILFASKWNRFESQSIVGEVDQCTLYPMITTTGEQQGLVKYVWAQCANLNATTSIWDKAACQGEGDYCLNLQGGGANSDPVKCDSDSLKTVGTHFLKPFLWVFLAFVLTSLLINLYTWTKSQDFSQWLFGQYLVGKDGKRLNLTQMAIINSFFIIRCLSVASLYFALQPDLKIEQREAWIASSVQGFLVFTVVSIIDALPLMFYGKTALEWITETKCAVK